MNICNEDRKNKKGNWLGEITKPLIKIERPWIKIDKSWLDKERLKNWLKHKDS